MLITLSGNKKGFHDLFPKGITLRSDYAPNRGCIYRTSANAYNLNQVPRIEADVRTSGNGGQWFSLWLDPIQYVQPPRNSGEIDLIENLPSVATNFAGCKGAYCAQRSGALHQMR